MIPKPSLDPKGLAAKPLGFHIRQPVVAGIFYPGEKEALVRQISEFLKQTPEVKKQPVILIVPHAGYQYSGLIAAAGFKQLAEKGYSTVILLGVSHSAYFEGAALDENEAWKTPLGRVLIDKNLAKKIAEVDPRIFFSSPAHAQEHSLEVELPFLQLVLADFKIVPLLLGQADNEFLEVLADGLAKNITGDTLVVVSTDLSHYPPYEVANKVDRATIKAILSGDFQNFEATTSAQMVKNYPGLETCACGEKAVGAGMILAKKLGEGEWKLLRYANSGDLAGEKGRVVGYGAIGYFGKFKIKNEKELESTSKSLSKDKRGSY